MKYGPASEQEPKGGTKSSVSRDRYGRKQEPLIPENTFKPGKRVKKEAGSYDSLPTEQIWWLAEENNRAALKDPLAGPGLQQELDDRGVAMNVQNAAAMTDLTLGAVQNLSGLTGVGQTSRLVKNIPAVGSVTGLVQAVSQQASKTNPYGAGLPSGWHIFNDVAEGAIGFAGKAAPPVQFVFGGALSDMANNHNAGLEAKKYADMLAAAKSPDDMRQLESETLYLQSRDWDRNKLSQVGSSGLLAAENKRRAAFRTGYMGATTFEQRRKMMKQELDDRAAYDDVMGGASWATKLTDGFKANSMQSDSEQAEYIHNWVKWQKASQESARNEGIPSL